jgi:hypothetical protein
MPKFAMSGFRTLRQVQSVRVDVAVPLSEGLAMAIVSVRPWQGYKMARESDPDKHPDVAIVGYPPRPR